MKRRDVVKLAGLPVALTALPSALRSREPDEAVGPATLTNRQFRLILSPGIEGLGCRLEHLPSGRMLADGRYFYSFGIPVFHAVRREPAAIVLIGQFETGVAIEQRFALAPDADWLEEGITLTNISDAVLDLGAARSGFMLETQWGEQGFSAVPFLREPSDQNRSRYSEFSLDQVLNETFTSRLWHDRASGKAASQTFPYFAAEGWIWRQGDDGFLISKYSQQGMEWAILDHVPLEGGAKALRWGGFGMHLGNPEPAAKLRPGDMHSFGVTRVTPFQGARDNGFRVFRDEMTARGHGCPDAFDPPIHWNELYNNKLWHLPGDQSDDPASRARYYSLADMKAEAALAQAMGCEALYLDPGWDTNFASKIWDAARLGSFKAFIAMLASDYGLKCSLHTPMAGWCNPTSFPPDSYRRDRAGRRAEWALKMENSIQKFEASPLCGASRQYLVEAAHRLKALARDGAAFFMFDGTNYTEPCWDPDHGHAVPARRTDFVDAAMHLARDIHKDFPGVLIEMHDPLQPWSGRFAPLYYGHGRTSEKGWRRSAASFDSIWAFELMWSPMKDLLSGQSLALYYYNLAYSLPLYIHIDLRTDNENALVFWWNASTCRHLGVGGTHENPAIVTVQKEAIRTYRRLKPYYAQGIFHGIDEMIHAHVGIDRRSAVINCFNLSDEAVIRTIRFDPIQVGMRDQGVYRFRNMTASRQGKIYSAQIEIPAKGHRLIEVM